MNSIIRKFAVAVSSVAIVASVAGAQEVTFVGSTNGSFDCMGNTIGGLTFTSGTFDVTTADGFAAIGGSGGDNLGTLALTSTPFTYTGRTFNLQVVFSAPTGAGTQSFNATLLGTVRANGSGGASIVFANNTVTGTFDQGTYTLAVDNVSITPGRSGVEITGRVTANVVPEPSTYMLLATGIGALGLVARRRRTNV